METEEIRKKLKNKNYNQETIDYIIQYINLNKELYGHILNVDEQFLDRITTNLKSNITTVDFKNNSFKKEISRLFKMITLKIGGMYDKREQKIFINPIRNLQSKLFKKDASMMLTRIMHELDHVATAATFEDENGKKKTVLGIADTSENIDLSLLNEGITAFKEEAYAKKLGSEFHSSYKDEKKVAEFLANIIREENLIKYHFNNDYESIKKAFYEKTGVDLDTVVKVLNEESKTGKRRNPLKKIFKKKNSKIDEMSASITKKRTESKSHSWDLSNCGIDKEQVRKETPQIAKNFKETSEKSTINDTQKILEDIDEKIH